jgi:hypothetical protein
VATATDVMSKTMEGRMSNLQDLFDFARVELGNKLKPVFSDLINLMYKMVDGLRFLAQNFERIGAITKDVIVAGLAYVGAQKLIYYWTERNVIIGKTKEALDRVRLVLQGQKILALNGEAASMNVLTAAETRAVAAANAFNASLQKNAIVLAFTVALYGLYEVYKGYTEAVEVANSMSLNYIKLNDEAIKSEKTKGVELGINIEKIKGLALGTKERKEKVEELMKVYPEYFKNLTAEQVSNWHLDQVYKGVNAQIERKIDLMAKEQRVKNTTDRLVKLKLELDSSGVGTNLADYNKKLNEQLFVNPVVVDRARKDIQEYNKLLVDIQKHQNAYGQANIKQFNESAKIAQERLKSGKITVDQFKSEITLLQNKHQIFVQNYEKEEKIIKGSVDGNSKANKAKKDDTEKTLMAITDARLKNEKLEVEAMEKSFEKEMELNGIVYEQKKLAAQKEIKDQEQLKQRLMLLSDEYHTKKLEIEKKYADLESSYIIISNTRIEASVKKLHLATVDLKEWEVKRKVDLDKRLEQIDEDEKKRKENLIKLEEQRIDLAIQVFNYGTNDQPVVQSLGNIAGAYQKLLNAQKNGVATAQDSVNVYMALVDAAKQIMAAINEHRENNKEILSSAYKAAGDVFRDFSEKVGKYMVVDYKAQLQEQLKASEGHFEAQKKLLDAYAAKVKETMTDAFKDTDFSEEVSTAMDSIFEEMSNFTPPGSMGLFDKIPFLSDWKEEKFAEDVDDYFKRLGYSSMEGAYQFVDDTEKVLEALEAQKDGLEFYYSEMVRITREKYGEMSDEVNSNLSAQLATLNTWYEGQRDVINDIYSDILNNVVVYQDDIFDATMTGWDTSKKAAEDSLLGEKGITEENYDELLDLRKGYYQRWKDKVNGEHEEKMKDLKSQLDAGVITQKEYDDAVVVAKGILKQRLDAIDAKIKKDRDADLLDLKQNYLDKKVAAEQKAADEISEINRKMNADIAGFESSKKSEVLRINYEMFEAERKMALANLDIQEVIAVAKIIAANPLFHKNKVNEIRGIFAESRGKINGAANPYGGDMMMDKTAPENRNDAIPQGGGNNNEPQSFGMGGMFRDSSYFENHGVLGGLSHNTPEGGNWVINPRTKKILAKVEANEWIGVVNKNVTSRYGTLLEQLSRSSVATTGKPIYAEDGYFGVLDESSSKNAVYGLAETQVGNMALLVQKMEKQSELTATLIERVSSTLPILESVANSSARTADKDLSISINNIIEAADIVADVDSRSRFA